MLRILDARTGEPVTAAPARRGLTRVAVHACGLGPTTLRVLLTADLLVRALELDGTPVWTALVAPGRHAELRTAATALGIRPFEDDHDPASGPGAAQVVHVVAADAADAADVPGGGPVVAVAPAAGAPEGARGDWGPGGAPEEGELPAARAASAPGAGPGNPPDTPLTALLADPSALRLALLSVPRGAPVRVDGARLDGAAADLGHWRLAVAGWARRPSRPVPDRVRARLRAAWEDDLDLPGVLDVLRDVAQDPELPDGARFETYAYADRLLALDLARDLGGPA
ncbi:hypothetical protein QQY24_26440 [Streptomyces sp. TG1A-8]|uniref:hypothetical protein n=1 Tax=Streptomyces sp. TG1A-8 TaxID=3051385 RepID=UPI00265C1F68|nr:hypothetical protein [Streptomyces sp. TG1A-8]MDO0928779.1 hypothetical protein [Streptomyces sp. TG1A-8]